MRKKPSMSRMRKLAWGQFSLYVRRKDADKNGIVSCVTCGAKGHYTKMHAGHFIHGVTKQTYLDERNVHPQDVKCNMYLSGNLIEYTAYMRTRYGWETIDHLRELSHQVIKHNREYYETIINLYKNLLEQLDGIHPKEM